VRWTLLLLVCACQAPVEAELELTLAHTDPLALREVLVTRYREASAKGILPLTSARAVPGAGTVALTLIATMPTCDDTTLSGAMAIATELATGSGRLAIHEASPEGAKQLANHLRTRLGVDVRVPFDRQGLVVVEVPDTAVLREFSAAHPDLDVVTSGEGHWVVAKQPALTSADLSATELSLHERAAIDLVFRPEAHTRLRELSERSRLRPLPILIDDAFALAPTLASRASEGRLRLDLGDRHDLARRLAMTTLTVAPALTGHTQRCRTTRE
jgi:hypothetical protein